MRVIGPDCARQMSAVFVTDDIRDVSLDSMQTYRTYLESRLPKGCLLTGLEEFEWEMYYLEEGGDLGDWEALRREKPSCKDHYRLLSLLPLAAHADDLVARVKRVSDKRVFDIGLSWLVAVDGHSPEFDILWCYSKWWSGRGGEP